MKVTIINQHSCNRGDDAQLISSLEALKKRYPQLNTCNIHYNSTHKVDIPVCAISINHFTKPNIGRLIIKIFSLLVVFFPNKSITGFISKKLGFDLNYFESDIIINAAGGSNLGVYKDWYYLAHIRFIQNNYKEIRLVNFGNSIEKTNSLIFNHYMKKALTSFNCFLLRESLSIEHARSMNITCQKTPDIVLYEGLKEKICQPSIDFLDSEYIVCCFNNLSAWHPEFLENNQVDEFYLSVVNSLLKKGFNILVIPQLYGDRSVNYETPLYYEKLFKIHSKNYRLSVLDEKYSVLAQLHLISNCKYLIGARYHSLIYSIKYRIPFISLSYENKMLGLLNDIGLSDNSIDLRGRYSLHDFDKKFTQMQDSRDIIAARINQYLQKARHQLNVNLNNVFR